eukprot:TRINITY_DN30476_c0_g1_i1.p1 TRINITY_DN30476_c0_g1~~TRINITY_DN30476_c0_g1_i1.p1  ORF type:complete len:352 (-),score=78.54 TRINITY_DN30476_c0_g1_i1:276-1331(-)
MRPASMLSRRVLGRHAGAGFATSAKGNGAHIRTPLIYSEAFSKQLGADVYLKMDCMQPPGSFKIRGIGETVRRAASAGAKCIVSSSGGNAGLAAAYAARGAGLPCTVVLPTTTPEFVHGRLREFGADVVVHGGVWDEADQRAREVVEQQNGAYVHPFDQQSTWDGNATIIDELAEQMPGGRRPDAVITCVGGGGLLMGIIGGLEAHGWLEAGTRVIACETEGASSLGQSMAAGELVTLQGITSIAKSLGALRVSASVFEKCMELKSKGSFASWITTDAAALRACMQLATSHRVLVEPACGAALAAPLAVIQERSEMLQGCETVAVEVCGGALVDVAAISAWASDLQVPLTL